MVSKEFNLSFPNYYYLVFFALIIIILIIDGFLLKTKGNHKISIKESLAWTIVWIMVTFIFALWLFVELSYGQHYSKEVIYQVLLQFYTGYLLEKSLSLDNIFVMLLIFSFFKIPSKYQHRILLYGIFGAIILRVVMIYAGAAIIHKFEWVLLIFAIFLIYSSFKIVIVNQNNINYSNHFIIRLINRFIPITTKINSEKFFIRENNILMATPLFIAMILIEVSDVIFALDSIPAIFLVTTDPFLVFTSNIFAILGLRALFFLVADMSDRFENIKYGISFILIFIGIKMLIAKWVEIPNYLSVLIILSSLVLSIIYSIFKSRHNR